MCTFWLVEALTRAGRSGGGAVHLREDADLCQPPRAIRRSRRDPRGEALGNFPQAFTHMGSISAAYNLDRRLQGAA